MRGLEIMTFKHRLSRRLAVLRTVALLLPAVIGGCTGTDSLDTLGPRAPGSTTEPDAVVAIKVKPPTMVLETNQGGQFHGAGYTATGDSLTEELDWTVSGGTITSSGLFTSSTAGTFLVVGRRKGHNKTPPDTSVVVVVPPDTNLVAITVTPSIDTLPAGGRQAFVASGKRTDSSTTQVAVNWAATGGTIDGTGTYQAGNQAGTYRVVATNTAGTVADTVPVTVSEAPAPVLASVVLTPSTASVTAGATFQFNAYGRSTAGDSMSISPVYSATGGAINSTGVFTAGPTAGTYRVIAGSGGLADTSVVSITAPAPTLAQVILVPGSAALTVGATQQFAAWGKTTVGDSVPVSVTYSATGGTITSGGVYTAGPTAGSYRVVARQSGGALADTAGLTLSAVPSPTVHAGYYVAPNGTSGGNGSLSQPWDLRSALSGGKSIAPGDTVWVRGGTYRTGELLSYVQGTSAARVVVRAYPGERATIDGYLAVFGAYATFWGLEVMNSNPVASGALGINVKAPGSRFINLIVHDAGASGMGVWVEAPDAEVYGSLVYNNGTHPNLDHGIYTQNQSGLRRIRDNVIFNNWTYGLHAYSSTQGFLTNIELDGNVSFNNGTTGTWGTAPDYLVGGVPASGIKVTNNLSYRRNDGETTARFGYGGTNSQDLTLTGNYFVGPMDLLNWASVSQSGNTLVPSSSPPSSGTKVVVRRNAYEAGRANVIAYDWSGQASVSVDLSGVLQAGDAYEVRNVMSFFGTPVAQGVYGGGAIQIPITAASPPPTIGRTAKVAPSTGTTFNVFVVLKTN